MLEYIIKEFIEEGFKVTESEEKLSKLTFNDGRLNDVDTKRSYIMGELLMMVGDPSEYVLNNTDLVTKNILLQYIDAEMLNNTFEEVVEYMDTVDNINIPLTSLSKNTNLLELIHVSINKIHDNHMKGSDVARELTNDLFTISLIAHYVKDESKELEFITSHIDSNMRGLVPTMAFIAKGNICGNVDRGYVSLALDALFDISDEPEVYDYIKTAASLL